MKAWNVITEDCIRNDRLGFELAPKMLDRIVDKIVEQDMNTNTVVEVAKIMGNRVK